MAALSSKLNFLSERASSLKARLLPVKDDEEKRWDIILVAISIFLAMFILGLLPVPERVIAPSVIPFPPSLQKIKLSSFYGSWLFLPFRYLFKALGIIFGTIGIHLYQFCYLLGHVLVYYSSFLYAISIKFFGVIMKGIHKLRIPTGYLEFLVEVTKSFRLKSLAIPFMKLFKGFHLPSFNLHFNFHFKGFNIGGLLDLFKSLVDFICQGILTILGSVRFILSHALAFPFHLIKLLIPQKFLDGLFHWWNHICD